MTDVNQGAVSASTPAAAPFDPWKPRQFRKKPVVIEAVQWQSGMDHPGVGFEPVKDGEQTMFCRPYVTTIHGQRAYLAEGDWIIPESAEGMFYPCKPDIFEATYELAAPAQPDASEGDEAFVEFLDAFNELFCSGRISAGGAILHRLEKRMRPFVDALARSARARAPGTDAGEAQPVAWQNCSPPGSVFVCWNCDSATQMQINSESIVRCRQCKTEFGKATWLPPLPPAALDAGLARAVEIVERAAKDAAQYPSRATSITAVIDGILAALRAAATSNGGSRT